MLTQRGGAECEVVALGEVLRLRSGPRVKFCGRTEVTSPLVQVRSRRGIPRQRWVKLGKRSQSRLRSVRLTDGDGAAGRQSTDRLLNARDS